MTQNETSVAGKGCKIITPTSEKKSLKEIERSIIKTYRKSTWAKFVKAIREYELLEDGDKVAVGISGGKDSLIMAKLFQELKRQSVIKFDIEFLAMDPGYHPDIKDLLIDNCKHLDIPIHLFDSGIFEILDEIAQDNPCFMCARMRRGALYTKAEELGCNKLALGHHFNDVIETTMLNILYSGNYRTMIPKLKADNFNNMELIRTMYYIEEKDIIRFINNSGVYPLNCACMVAAKKTSGKRQEMKELIANLKKTYENVDKSIFKSAQNVNMNAILGWEKDGEKHSFLDIYDK